MSFTILKKDRKTRARTGILRTPHGIVHTPSYVMVATHAQIKTLKPTDIKKTKTQIVIANTYHLWDKAKRAKSETRPNGHSSGRKGKAKSLVTELLGTKLPTMTDSGGFQVFSLGAAKEHGVGKVLQRAKSEERKVKSDSSVRFTEKGAYFNIDGEKKFLSPEISMELQKKIGADIIFAFDECTSPLHAHAYQKSSMERTHRWLKRCITALAKSEKQKGKRSHQMLYGIIQGGRSKSLRRASAKFVASQPVDGIGIGGSFGKDETAATLSMIAQYLPEEKPRHLLGIGRIEDIFIAVENGIDTFDCVIPTREARHGRIWTPLVEMPKTASRKRSGFHYGAGRHFYDIRKSRYKNDHSRLAPRCGCPACAKGMTKAKLRSLFCAKNPEAGRGATLHNIWFFNSLVEKIRRAITRGEFSRFKQAYLKNIRRF